MISRSRFDSKQVAFIVLCVVAIGGAGLYLSMARLGARPIIAAGVVPSIRVPGAVASLRKQPYVAFRNLAPGDEYGTLAFAPLDDRRSEERRVGKEGRSRWLE